MTIIDTTSLSTSELATELVDGGRRMAAAECRWLENLAEFDRREGWFLDRQLSGAEWLAWRCGMARSTAKDKLRVGHALRSRPLIRDAFARGDITYSMVRAITRIIDADEDTDRALLALAAEGTVADLEQVAYRWKQLRDQERGVDPYLRRYDRRRFGASTTYDGMGVTEVVLPREEHEELQALVAMAGEPVDKASAEAAKRGRVDALMRLMRAGAAALGEAALNDHFLVHVVADLDALIDRIPGARATLVDGTPVGIETLRRMTCDTSVVRHVMAGDSEMLDVGRRTKQWSTAQRRAVKVRDGGICRFVNCTNRLNDVHHLVHWADGGPTSVDNGCLLCRRHHTLLHEGGFGSSGDLNGDLGFYRPDGTFIGSTLPLAYTQAA